MSKMSTYKREQCKHKHCFYCSDNEDKPQMRYQSVLDFEKACREHAASMTRASIETSFIKELQGLVNDSDGIK